MAHYPRATDLLRGRAWKPMHGSCGSRPRFATCAGRETARILSLVPFRIKPNSLWASPSERQMLYWVEFRVDERNLEDDPPENTHNQTQFRPRILVGPSEGYSLSRSPAYAFKNGDRSWIITEADRSSIFIL